MQERFGLRPRVLAASTTDSGGRATKDLAALGVAGRVGASTERRGRSSPGARERAVLSPPVGGR